jgi:hypothetical protein
VKVRRDVMPPQHVRHRHDIAVRGVHRGADGHLAHRRAGDLADRHDVVGTRRLRDQRLESREVDRDVAVVLRVRVGPDRLPVLLAPLRLEKAPGLLVRRKNRRRGAELLGHVGDRRPLGDGEVVERRPHVLHHGVESALHGEPAQELEDEILGGDPGRKPADQVHALDAGHLHVERLAGHDGGHLGPAGADGQHAERSRGAGVGVRADQSLGGLPEALEMGEMGNAVPGPRVDPAVLVRHRLEVQVVVGVLEAGLEHVVIDVRDADRGVDALHAEPGKLLPHHGAGGVLDEHLVDADPHLAVGLENPFDQVIAEKLVGQGQPRVGCETASDRVGVHTSG